MSVPRTAVLLPLLLIAFALLAGCQREEPPPVTAPPPRKPALHVVVPKEVAVKWKAVQIVARDKQTGRDLLFTVDVGGRFALPESTLQVEVTHFLPAFVTDGKVATSVSNNPQNPGVEVIVRDGAVEIFRGWLLRNAPEDHGFKHPRYTLALQDFIARR